MHPQERGANFSSVPEKEMTMMKLLTQTKRKKLHQIVLPIMIKPGAAEIFLPGRLQTGGAYNPQKKLKHSTLKYETELKC